MVETAGFHREKRVAAPRKRAGAASDVPFLFRGGAGSHGEKTPEMVKPTLK